MICSHQPVEFGIQGGGRYFEGADGVEEGEVFIFDELAGSEGWLLAVCRLLWLGLTGGGGGEAGGNIAGDDGLRHHAPG